MIEGTLSNVLIVESDDKVYFVEDKSRKPKLQDNKLFCENVNKNKVEIFKDDESIASHIK